MIDIIKTPLTGPQLNQVLHRPDEVFLGQHSLLETDIDPKFYIDLVSADTSEIIFFGIEKKPLQQPSRIRHRRRVSRAETAVNFLKSLLFAIDRILLQGLDNGVIALQIDDGHRLNTQRKNLGNTRLRERFECSGDCDLPIQDVGNQNLGRNELLLQ